MKKEKVQQNDEELEEKDKELENDEELEDNYNKLIIDLNFLRDKVVILRDKINKTPWYHIATRIKFLKEIDDLKKEAHEIEERLKKFEKNPITIVKRS